MFFSQTRNTALNQKGEKNHSRRKERSHRWDRFNTRVPDGKTAKSAEKKKKEKK